MHKFHFRDFAPVALTLPAIENKKVSWGYFANSLGLLRINQLRAPRFYSQKSAFARVKKISSDLTSEG